MVGTAVRADIEEKRVLVAVHLLGDAAQRALEVGDRRERELLERLLAVDERDRVSGRAKALVEQAPHKAHLPHEYVLAGIGREADEEKFAHARAPRLQRVERALDQLALQMEQSLLGE